APPLPATPRSAPSRPDRKSGRPRRWSSAGAARPRRRTPRRRTRPAGSPLAGPSAVALRPDPSPEHSQEPSLVVPAAQVPERQRRLESRRGRFVALVLRRVGEACPRLGLLQGVAGQDSVADSGGLVERDP